MHFKFSFIKVKYIIYFSVINCWNIIIIYLHYPLDSIICYKHTIPSDVHGEEKCLTFYEGRKKESVKFLHCTDRNKNVFNSKLEWKLNIFITK